MLQFIWKEKIGISWVACIVHYSCLIIRCSGACMIHSPCLIVYFICRLKINHDSHEFIVEFTTVVNKYKYVKIANFKAFCHVLFLLQAFFLTMLIIFQVKMCEDLRVWAINEQQKGVKNVLVSVTILITSMIHLSPTLLSLSPSPPRTVLPDALVAVCSQTLQKNLKDTFGILMTSGSNYTNFGSLSYPGSSNHCS